MCNSYIPIRYHRPPGMLLHAFDNQTKQGWILTFLNERFCVWVLLVYLWNISCKKKWGHYEKIYYRKDVFSPPYCFNILILLFPLVGFTLKRSASENISTRITARFRETTGRFGVEDMSKCQMIHLSRSISKRIFSTEKYWLCFVLKSSDKMYPLKMVLFILKSNKNTSWAHTRPGVIIVCNVDFRKKE